MTASDPDAIGAARVRIIAATKRAVTVRHPDGREQTVPGRHVLCVYCQPGDIARHLAGDLHDRELSATLDGETLVVVARALYA